MKSRKIKPVHPGRILREEFMEPSGVSQYRLAQASGHRKWYEHFETRVALVTRAYSGPHTA